MRQMKIDKKKMRFVVFVSLMVILCGGVLWWIFSSSTIAETSSKKTGGLNMQLPAANVGGDTARDKLSFYSVALADSLKRAEQIRMDPYRRDSVIGKVQMIHSGDDQLEARVKAIQKQMVAPAFTDYAVANKKSFSEEQEQQRKIVQPVADPEMEAINSTLDKIMAIQNPQKPIDVIAARNSFAVSTGEGVDTTYFGKRSPRKSAPVFYHEAGGVVGGSAIAAVVPVEQILQSGSVVKLELRVAVVVNGVTLPAGTNVFGIASLEGERLMIVIPSIQYQNNLIPVSLMVYDLDGLEGIRVPGSLFRDVAKASTDNAIQSAGVAGFDFSLKTQIAAAGIGAAKNLLSKKVKQVTVTITAGYQVLLRDNKQSGR